MQIAIIRIDNEERESLARERQYLWSKMAHNRHSPELTSMGDRVDTITRRLNGHVYDTRADDKPRATATGGMWEQKRHDRKDVEVHLHIHELQRAGLYKEGGDGPKSQSSVLKRVTPQLRRIVALQRDPSVSRAMMPYTSERRR